MPANPVITSLSATAEGPGAVITITGQNFGAPQGNGYVLFSDAGVNWGGPKDVAAFNLMTWTDTKIDFQVPLPDPRGYQTSPGTTATVTVTNSNNLTSNTVNLQILDTPVITSLSPTRAAPGDTVVINGQNFGVSQGAGYVLFADAGVNWGGPGDIAAFKILSWSDKQITFMVPIPDYRGYQAAPGVALITVTNANNLASSNGLYLTIVGQFAVTAWHYPNNENDFPISPTTGPEPFTGLSFCVAGSTAAISCQENPPGFYRNFGVTAGDITLLPIWYDTVVGWEIVAPALNNAPGNGSPTNQLINVGGPTTIWIQSANVLQKA